MRDSRHPDAGGRRRARRRAVAAVVLVVAASLLFAVGATALYVKEEIAPERPFAARLVSSLDDPAVRGVVAQRTVDALVNGPTSDLLPFRPLLLLAVDRLAGTDEFRRLLAFGLADAHRALVAGEGSITVRVEGTARLLLGAIRSVSPAVARRTPGDPRPVLTRVDRDNVVLRVLRALQDHAAWAWPLLALAALAAIGALVLAPDRRRTTLHLGAGLAGAGTLIAGLVWVGGRVATGHAARRTSLGSGRERRALDAVWDALFADLRVAAVVVALAGLLLAAVAAGLGSWAADLTRTRERLGAVRIPPAVRSAGLLALGAACLLAPGLLARAVVVLIGVALLVAGAQGAATGLHAAWRARRPVEPSAAGAAPGSAAAHRPGSRSALAAAGGAVLVACALTAAAAIAFNVPALPVLPTAPSAGCNGSRTACDRRLDAVLWPATHNSYAASDQAGWFFANQRRDIARQLDDGITGLLLDVHWGVLDRARGLVRTDFDAEGADRNKVVRALEPRQRQAAERVAGRIGAPAAGGPPQLYLCHTLCELGAEPLDAELRVIRRHLDREPGAVLLLIVEDYVPPSAMRGALERAGLLREVATLDRTRPLPTLGELVRDDRRLVVFAEKDGGAHPWYMPAFSFIQDTPLGARSRRDFRCTRSRGDADSPFLLLNHWIDRFPPRPSDNARVGGAVLAARLDACRKQRGTGPGIVAVDFYERSGVIALARRYNGA